MIGRTPGIPGIGGRGIAGTMPIAPGGRGGKGVLIIAGYGEGKRGIPAQIKKNILPMHQKVLTDYSYLTI